MIVKNIFQKLNNDFEIRDKAHLDQIYDILPKYSSKIVKFSSNF